MRFLVISPTPSHPQNAGNRQRIQALLRRIRDFGHQIDFCFVQRESVREEDLEAMRAAWDALILVPHDRAAERRSLGEIHGIDDWFQPQLAERLTALAESRRYDAVLVEYVFLSKALDFFPPEVLKIIDTHDVFADRHQRLRSIGLEPAFFYTSAVEEGRGLDRADLVLAIQDEERAQLEEMTRAAVITLGYLPDVPEVERARKDRDAGPVIGYLGSVNPINQAALKAFLQAADLPGLAERGAWIEIGGGAGQAVAGMGPPLQALGVISDPAPFYAGLDLAVNPHQGGTGLKIKSVEALAHGCPLIGTADALLGLEPEQPFHAAPDAASLASVMERFVREPAFREAVAKGSRALLARYARQVSRQAATFRSEASLRRAVERPRALLVTDLPFWQENLGNLARICEMLRVGRQWLDFDILALRTVSDTDRAAAQQVIGGRGRIFSFKDYPEPAGPGWIEGSARLRGFERQHFSRRFFAALEAHLAVHAYDLCIVEYIRLSYLRHARRFPRLSALDTHDVMSLRAQNFAHFGLDHHIRIDVEEELRIMDGFSLLLAIQSAEHRFLAQVLPGKSLYLPHSLPHFRRNDVVDRPRRVVFVGGDSPMNRDGLRWFLQQVWPCFHDHGAVLHVAGTVCDSLGDLASPGRVELHGPVADLDAFLSAADIGINPVFYGGGLKIKTVEYLCRGIPSVLTREAVFGIEGGEGRAYRLARSRREFVAQLHVLLTDAGARQACAEAAYVLGRRAFSRGVSGSALCAMAELARAAAPARAAA